MADAGIGGCRFAAVQHGRVGHVHVAGDPGNQSGGRVVRVNLVVHAVFDAEVVGQVRRIKTLEIRGRITGQGNVLRREIVDEIVAAGKFVARPDRNRSVTRFDEQVSAVVRRKGWRGRVVVVELVAGNIGRALCYVDAGGCAGDRVAADR